MIIDCHTHCFPDKIAHRAISALCEKAGLPNHTNGTRADLARVTRLSGIDKAVIMPIATKPEQTAKINRWAFESQNDTLRSFGTLHPEFASFRAEIRWLAEHAIRGIKLHPESQDFYVDDQRYFPMYEAVFSAGLAILFHAGKDVAFRGPWHGTPERLARVLDAFPGGVIIAAHMGGYQFWDDVEKHLLGRDLFLDTSFSYKELGEKRLLDMIRRHGTDKILFASDSPWADQAVELAEIRSLDLTTAEKTAILGGNAARLLL